MKEEPLELWTELRRAQQMPKTVQVAQMLDAMEVTAAQLPEAERLQFAGEALLQIADLCAARAGLLMTEWEEAYRDPVVPQEFFGDLVRQTMAVDLSELMEPAPPRKPRAPRSQSTETEAGSIVATVDKAAALALVDQLEVEAAVEERKQQVLRIAHDENVSRWIEAIAQGLRAAPLQRVPFAELCRSAGLSRVEAWLGVLFGEFELEQGDEFYGDALWVTKA